MTDPEERPSKIRKLDKSENSHRNLETFGSHVTASKQDPVQEIQTNGEQDEAEAKPGPMEDKPALSKSQLKKLKKAEAWEAGREYRKLKRREKHKEKQARKAEVRAKIANGELPAPEPVKKDEGKPKRPPRPIQVPVALILDCDFNELMTEKELISLGAQLTRCYSENRSAIYRTHYAISSWGGSLKSRFETVLVGNHLQWRGVNFFEKDFEVAAVALDGIMRGPEGGKVAGALAGNDTDNGADEGPSALFTSIPVKSTEASGDSTVVKAYFIAENDEQKSLGSKPDSILDSLIASETAPPPGQPPQLEESSLGSQDPSTITPSPSVVYLTSDSPHTLTHLSPNTSYIIGGIVDKNRHKGICYKRACERGIPTAKLPIGEYMTMQSRSVLAINHVVEIMLKWLETGDWGEAFLSVIPKRKEARLKEKKGEIRGEGEQNSSGECGEDEDEDVHFDVEECSVHEVAEDTE